MKIMPMLIDEKLIQLVDLRGGQEYLKAIITKAVFDDLPNLYEAHKLGFKDDDFKEFDEWKRPLYDEAKEYLNKRAEEKSERFKEITKEWLNRR